MSCNYNGAKMHQALQEIARITITAKSDFDVFAGFERILKITNNALAEPPRNCDVMSLETARKVWYMKEIFPRLTGDLPLGKEVPFEEWFVSQQEQGGAK